MTNIICDVCKRPVAYAGRTYSWATRFELYDTIKDKDLCPDCLGVLLDEVEKVMAETDDYQFLAQKQALEDKLEELTVWDEREKDKVLGYE